MVEQWTENPCVPGSIPGGTTENIRNKLDYQVITDFLCFIGFFNNFSGSGAKVGGLGKKIR